MLDTTLKHPILGVQCDHPIVGGQTANIQPLIAVLHPNILAIYKLEGAIALKPDFVFYSPYRY